jgi:hypothetical protein
MDTINNSHDNHKHDKLHVIAVLRDVEALLSDDEIRSIVRKELLSASASHQGNGMKTTATNAQTALSWLYRLPLYQQFYKQFFTRPTMIASSILASLTALTLVTFRIIIPTQSPTTKQALPTTQSTQPREHTVRQQNNNRHNASNDTYNSIPQNSNIAQTQRQQSISGHRKKPSRPNLLAAEEPQTTLSDGKQITPTKPINTDGVRFLELTAKEAERFGLLLQDTVLSMAEQGMSSITIPDEKDSLGRPKTFNTATVITDFSEHLTRLYFQDSLPKEMQFQNVVKQLPFLVTSSTAYDKRMKKRMYVPCKDSLWSKLSQMIAFGFDVRRDKSKAYDEGSQQWGGYVVLWYEPTPEVIAALPERYRVQLEHELGLAVRYSSLCEIRNSQERETLEEVFAGKPLLDTWRSCSGVLSTKPVAPNPARETTTVKLKIDEPRIVSISIHDVRGQFVETLMPERRLNKGEHEINVNLGKQPFGMYLLLIHTNRGEQAIQRVIIEQ